MKTRPLQLLFLIMCIVTYSYAQTIKPAHYWTFNERQFLKEESDGKLINVKNYNCPIDQVQSKIGKAVDMGRRTCPVVTGGLISVSGSFTVEFVFKGSQFVFLSMPQPALILRLNSGGLFFRTSHRNNGKVVTNDLSVPFKGSGLESYHYYSDEEWHHFAFTYDASSGSKQIWVDGQSPEGFKTVTSAGKLVLASNDAFRDTDVIDELAFYNEAIPGSLIKQHAAELEEGIPYSFQLRTIISSEKETRAMRAESASKSRSLDLSEFAPGYPDYSMQATDQLKSFPLARIFSDRLIERNMSWMDINYLHRELPGVGGKGFGKVNPRKAVELSEEMARNWNYYVEVPTLRTNASGAQKEYSSSNSLAGALVNFANRHPEYPYATILMQIQSKPVHAGLEGNVAYAISQNLPDKYYIRDENGKAVSFMNKKWLSPLMPLDIIEKDGRVGRFYLEQLLTFMHRPPALINENGEIFGHIRPEALLKMDMNVWKDFKSSGLSLSQYSGRFQASMDSVYRKQVLNLEKLKGTKFSFYNITAMNSAYWPDYATRHSLVQWQDNIFYSTPDFYPRTPDNWKYAKGAFNGYGAIAEGRVREISMGDRSFSPYVSAGWGKEESNIRPAQYLSLLKAMVMLGADFFYSGYFNVTGKNGKWPDGAGPNDPRGYAYQVAMPVYAQALRSWAPEFFDDGELLNPAPASDKLKQFRFRGKSESELILVRKSGKKYLISGSIQPESNIKGNVPEAKITTIKLDGQDINFEIRRQGSLYVLDKSGPEPVFYQLDRWHQFEHPSYWSKNLQYEAELFTNKSGKTEIRTENARSFHFGNLNTDLILYPGSEVSYNSLTRPMSFDHVKIMASNQGSESGTLKISMGGNRMANIQIKSGSKSIYTLTGDQLNTHNFSGTFQLEVIKGTIAIDYILIEANSIKQ